ncbi:MAG TPA: DEAD/DEAH box helicase, partial [Aquabacterium sp.]|nr:DEAD/DEAH box helicase [Aquabacterium sp.]
MPGDAVPATDAFGQLHPAVQYHVVNSLGWTTLRPTQLDAIAPIHAGCHCLLLAPTAGGKTEAAIIPVLSRMLHEQWAGTSVLYVCPIKALLNNLEARLSRYAGYVGRTVAVWHGDVSASRKKRVLAQPPDILLTTPESIEGMLISPRIERDGWFGRLRVVVIDELHAFAGDDRGWHLRALLSRLERYALQPVQRLGLSATVRNPEELQAWMAPTGERRIVGASSVSADADVVIDLVGSIDNAALVVSRLHRGRKRLVFCDARSVAERLGSCLHGLGVRTFVSHGSLSADERRRAEAAFAEEKDCVIVATSTLELGIDVGDLDHVLQIDAPSSVSSFLQRMGRTGRRAGSRRNCTFLALDDKGLLLAMAIVQLWREGWVENVEPPPAPWGVTAQQALALVLEHGQIARADLAARLGRAFPEQAAQDVLAVLEHLVSGGFLVESAPGVFIIGPATETQFGRGHYRDLLASFSGNPLLTGRHGTTEIGLIDPASLLGSTERPIVLLAGR